MRHSFGRVACLLPLLFLAARADAQPAAPAPPPQAPAKITSAREKALQAVEEMYALRRAQAVPTEMFSPFYSVAGGDQTHLYLLNNVADPVRLRLAALSPKGEVLPLGDFEIDVTRHLSLSLRKLVRGAGPEFLQGSLRLSFLGDMDSVQAWTVVSRGRQVVELPFETPSKSPSRELVAFWGDNRLEARPVLRLLNAGDRPLHYRILSLEPNAKPLLSRVLEPGQSHRIRPSARLGRVRILHDGEPGALKVAGLLEGRDHLSLVPVARREDWERTLTSELFRVPWVPGIPGSLMIHLLNAADGERQAKLEVVDAASGLALLNFNENIPASRLISMDLGARLAADRGATAGHDLRVRVSSTEPGVLLSGKSRLEGGEIIDLVAFRHQDGHASGSYPLLPLSTHETVSTIINVGDEPSEVVAQFYWAGGTYSFGPVMIEPGAAYRLDVAAVAARQEPDLLGRVLDPAYQQGFLKWSARHGSKALVARTEARPRGGRDSFGFNCIPCCGETPIGEVDPGSVQFFVGQSPTFEACYRIYTCNGVMGPYPTYPTSYTVPSPFSWNGSNISASSAARETVSFSGYEQGAIEGGVCVYQNMSIFGDGDASTCKNLLKKVHNPTQSWSTTQTCVSQVGSESTQKCSKCQACCNQILSYKECSKEGLETASSEHSVCLGNCATDICD